MKVSLNTHPFNLNFLLTKAASYGIPLEKKEKNNVFALHDIITNHELEQNDLARRTAEIASTEIISSIDILSWEQESITRAQAAINRLYRRVQDNPELSSWQVEVLDKANKYHIKYSLNNMDWFKLSDMIDELEPLISEAESYGICDWDANDIVNIRQQIEEAQHRAYGEHKQNCNDYFSSRI